MQTFRLISYCRERYFNPCICFNQNIFNIFREIFRHQPYQSDFYSSFTENIKCPDVIEHEKYPNCVRFTVVSVTDDLFVIVDRNTLYLSILILVHCFHVPVCSFPASLEIHGNPSIYKYITIIWCLRERREDTAVAIDRSAATK